MKNNPKLYWIRWIAILPAAILAYLLGYVAILIFNQILLFFNGHDNMEWLRIFAIPAIASGFAGYYYIIIGTQVAPYHEKIVAAVLTTLLFAGFIWTAIMAIQDSQWFVILGIVGSVIGVIISFKDVKETIIKKVVTSSEQYI